MDVHFKFKIGERVETPLGIGGRVKTAVVDGNGIDYQVEHLDHAGRVDANWYTESQLILAECVLTNASPGKATTDPSL